MTTAYYYCRYNTKKVMGIRNNWVILWLFLLIVGRNASFFQDGALKLDWKRPLFTQQEDT